MKRDIRKAIESASLDDLKEMEALIASTREVRDAQTRQDAMAAAAKAAKDHGYSIDDLFGKGNRRKAGKVAPKYRNPDDAATTWSGRGRKPKWVEAQLKKGKSLESMLIK